MRTIVIFSFGCLLLASCVGKKKFTAEFNGRTAAEQRESVLRTELADAKTQVTNLTTQVADLSRKLGSTEYVNGQLTQENEKLKGQVSNVSNTSSSQIQQLNKNLQEKTTALQRKDQIINDLQMAVKERNEALQTLYTRLDTTMQFYKTDGVKIEYKEDQAIVVIPAERLFTIHTATINKNGLAVLNRLAPALAGNINVDITVEGHTDNAKPKNRSFVDNWEFSAAQAVAVARFLTKGFDIAANQILPIGRSEFLPRASNETTEGRAQNRRVEIVISPKNTSLLRLMEKKLSGN